MRLNLHSRLAQRVLVQLAARRLSRRGRPVRAGARGRLGALVHAARRPSRSTSRRSTARCKSLNFAALRIKDAVCDRVPRSKRRAARASTRSGPTCASAAAPRPATRATLYIDTSGEPLFKRGWREDKGEAPLKETLAAAMLAASGWRGTAHRRPLHDPCCGAARSPSRRRRSPATSRRACCAASPSSGCCRSSAQPCARLAAAEGRGGAARARQRGADLRQRRGVPHGRLRARAMPSAPAWPRPIAVQRRRRAAAPAAGAPPTCRA